MITISETGYKIMMFNRDFEEFAAGRGIRDPFKVSQELFSERCENTADGFWIVRGGTDEREPSRAEKDNWIKMREEYVARRCFNEIGYETFLNRTKPKDYYDISYMRDLEEFVPCLSADRQCRMDCKKFGKCE